MPTFEVKWVEKVYFSKLVMALTDKEAEELATFNVEDRDETGRTETEIESVTKIEQ